MIHLQVGPDHFVRALAMNSWRNLEFEDDSAIEVTLAVRVNFFFSPFQNYLTQFVIFTLISILYSAFFLEMAYYLAVSAFLFLLFSFLILSISLFFFFL